MCIRDRFDAYAELEVARKADDGASALLSAEGKLSTKLDNLAGRIESIAESFEEV